jgi:hypothetical protein
MVKILHITPLHLWAKKGQKIKFVQKNLKLSSNGCFLMLIHGKILKKFSIHYLRKKRGIKYQNIHVLSWFMYDYNQNIDLWTL